MAEEGIKITISGNLNHLEPLMRQLLKLAVEEMGETGTMEQARRVWERWQMFHRWKEFTEAKEGAKRRLLNEK